MKLEGREILGLSRAETWQRIEDPEVLRACAPGLEKLEATGPDHYDAVLEVKVPAVTGRFEGSVDYLERQPPELVRLRLQGKGAIGFIDGEVTLTLAETDEGTECRYSADLQVGGQVARLGQRMLSGVSKEMAGQFFHNLERYDPSGGASAMVAPSVGGSFLKLIWRSLLRFFGLRRD